MRARARLATECDARSRTRVSELRSDWPLMLRHTHAAEPAAVTAWADAHGGAARIHVAGAAAGPVGGDELGMRVDVGPGSTLVLGEVSPTLLLAGPHGEESCLQLTVTVGAGATLAWLPQLVIAAHGCRHRTDIRITLEDGARLLLREEILFGRHGEEPGELRQRLRVRAAGRPLHDQELSVGPAACGWGGPAVTAGARCVGSLLVVDPGVPAPASVSAADSATMALPGPGWLASALAADTVTLRRRLDCALDALCPGTPITPRSAPPVAVPAARPDRRPA
jgi:urease accessory protein